MAKPVSNAEYLARLSRNLERENEQLRDALARTEESHRESYKRWSKTIEERDATVGHYETALEAAAEKFTELGLPVYATACLEALETIRAVAKDCADDLNAMIRDPRCATCIDVGAAYCDDCATAVFEGGSDG